MLLTVNGHEKEFSELSTVAELLGEMKLDPRNVVVELNERIVRRNQVEVTAITEFDSVEILRFVGGG